MGLYASHHLKRRVVFLETCGRLLQALWQEMSYTALPMPDLWRRLAQSESFAAFSLVQDTARGLSRSSFAAAFSAAVEGAEKDGLLLPPARRLLVEFAEGCGRTDLMGQQAHIEYYRTLLAAQEAESRRLWQEKGRVYRVLGLTGGVALMLLLI
ncbi:MAG: stage III sporulation protein AB [Clostridia bacterium]|nr:stage III sporulation protein AB [Clostridia bacterium]